MKSLECFTLTGEEFMSLDGKELLKLQEKYIWYSDKDRRDFDGTWVLIPKMGGKSEFSI